MDILEPFAYAYSAYNIAKQIWAIGAGVRRFSRSDMVQNTIAEVRVKARSTWLPTIIERLDDGTDPYNQRLRIDLAPRFTPERIAAAVYYRDSQSRDNLFKHFWLAVLNQAFRDAKLGDDLTIKVTLTYLDNLGIQDYVIHGKFDTVLPNIQCTPHINRQQFWPVVKTLTDANNQLRNEEKARRKAKRKEPG